MPDNTPNISFEADAPLDKALLSAVAKRFETPHVSTPSQLSEAERAEYLAMLRGEYPADILPDDQAHTLIDQLWAIMVAFVDLGFGLGKPLSAPASPCGKQSQKSPLKCDKAARAVLSSPHPATDKKDKMRKASAAMRGKGES